MSEMTYDILSIGLLYRCDHVCPAAALLRHANFRHKTVVDVCSISGSYRAHAELCSPLGITYLIMLLRLVVWRSRYILCAASNTPVGKLCTPRPVMRAFRRGLSAGNANRRRQCVCDPKNVVYENLPKTFAVPCIACCRQHGHSYHTATVSFLASKYDGNSTADDIPGVNPPSSGKQRDDENVEGLVNDSETASIVEEMNTDFRAALAVNEIELEERTHSQSDSDSVSEADILIERETQVKADSKEASQNFSSEESEPIDIDKELLKYDYEEFDDVYLEPEAEEIEEPTFPISLERMYAFIKCK